MNGTWNVPTTFDSLPIPSLPTVIPSKLIALSFKDGLLACCLCFAACDVASAFQTPEDQGQGPALSPSESFSKFKVANGFTLKPLLSDPQISQPLSTAHDAFGRLWVVQYLQYPDPAGLKRVSRDVFWRTVYDSIPLPPGHGGVRGADKITIHEDRDGDGTLETETTFVDGLNIATSVVPTNDGAWVLNPPYLLYYADANHDLKADGPPEVHLEGFGLEDTHSVVNSLCMGPDGWLYAAQGSTVSGAVRRYGSAEPPLKSMGQAIWRYHPQLKKYEIFAEGGGNAFSVAFDEHGEVYSGHNGGDTRGFHYRQEGYYRKGFNKHGSLSNPNSFGYLMPMKHDPIQRFTHAMLMTDGTAFDQKMHQAMLAVDPLHGKLINTELYQVGSTFETKDIEDALASEDKWFRPVAIQDGPDGAAYVCDWYDFQVAHLYAHVGKMDRDHGRVYRLAPSKRDDAPSDWNAVLANGTDEKSLEYLAASLEHPYRWQRWMARRLIANHPLKDRLFGRISNELAGNGKHVLDWLWVAHACGFLEDTIATAGTKAIPIAKLLGHPNQEVRAWSIRLACDDREVGSQAANAIRSLAQSENDARVLCQIASSCKRLKMAEALPIISELLQRSLSEDDLSLPLLVWWAVEPHAKSPKELREQLPWKKLLQTPIGRHRIAPNLIEVWAKNNSPVFMNAIAQTLADIQQLPADLRDDAAKHATAAFERAFQNRTLLGVPDSVIDALIGLGQPSLTLKLRRGDPAAKQEATRVLQDASVAIEIRMQIAQLCGELGHSDQITTLIELAKDTKANTRLRETSMSALSNFDAPSIGTALIELWPTLTSNQQAVAGSVLASRRNWTTAWLEACKAKAIESNTMPVECVRAMRLHADESIQQQLKEMYPDVQGANLLESQAAVANLLERIVPMEADPYRGKAQFKLLCARCHLLFAEGGEIGPDLTGYQRDQVSTLARNIIAPSLEIREGYQSYGILLEDGTVLTGYLESQQDDQIVLKSTDGKSHTINRSEIEKMSPQATSLMPDGILEKLTDQQVADLFAYLRSSQPLSD